MPWQKERKTRKTIKASLIFTIIALNLSLAVAQKKSINYKISDSAVVFVKGALGNYVQSYGNMKLIYVSISEFSSNTMFVVSISDNKGELADLINSSNRFLIITENYKIPILFEYDFDFALKENNSNSNIAITGFTLIMDKAGRILKSNWTQ